MVNPDLCRAKVARRSLNCDMNRARSAISTPSIAQTSAPAACLVRCRRHTFRHRRVGICCRAVSTTAFKSAEQLNYWADQHEKQLQNCLVESTKDTAVLLTSSSAQSGQSVLSVPDSSWISLQVVAKSPIGASVASLEPWLQLALYILFGLSHRDSEWSQYLGSLPAALDVPLLWDEDELDLLEGTQLLSTVQGYR